MRKVTWIGGLAVVVGLGYVAGVYLTAQQVNAEYTRYVSAITEHYQGIAEVSSSVDSALFASKNSLSIEFIALAEPVLDWAGTNTVSFDINFSHGFLSSSSVLKIAESDLLERLKAYQVQADKAPLQLLNNYSYDVFSDQLVVDGEVFVDGFQSDSEGVSLKIGATQGVFSLTGQDFSADLSSAPSSLAVADMIFSLGTLQLQQTGTAIEGDILTAKVALNSVAQLQVTHLSARGVAGGFNLDNVVLKFEQRIDKQRIVFASDYSATELNVETGSKKYQFDNPTLVISLDLDYLALLEVVQKIQVLQKKGDLENPSALLELVGSLTNKGVNLKIERVAITLADDTLQGNADLKMAPFSVEELMLDRQAVVDKIDLKAELTLPKQLLAGLPNYDPRQLDFVVNMGFLSDEGDNYRFTLNVKDGKIELNGQELPGM